MRKTGVLFVLVLSTSLPRRAGRNMVATPDGKLYLACSGVNEVAGGAGEPLKWERRRR